MPLPIEGTWLDFRHQNRHDGHYWNDQAAQFTAGQWRGKVAEIAGVGMDTIVIMSTALDDRAFYPSRFLPERWELACEDPVQAALSAASDFGVRVFVSAGFYGHTTEETSSAPDYLDWHRRHTEDLWARYHGHAAFHGWYIPNEAEIDGQFSDGYMQFTPRLASHLRQLAPSAKILVAPYGTNKVRETDRFVDQIGALGVDYIAYQDEVGVRKSTVGELDEIYSRLRRLHDRAGLPLWADVELFEFEGEVYGSALVPASIRRIRAQVEAIRPYVDKVLCYQYHGLMNPPESPQHCGHLDSVRLYQEYAAWTHELTEQRQ